MSGTDSGFISVPVLDDFYDAVAMKHEITSQFQLNSPGMPDTEFYRMQAKHQRAEYLADQLQHLIYRLKKLINTSAVEIEMPMVSKHSVGT